LTSELYGLRRFYGTTTYQYYYYY